MELLILFGIVSLLLLGPRRGGRMPGPIAIALGIVFLIWLAIALGIGTLWNSFFGRMPQP